MTEWETLWEEKTKDPDIVSKTYSIIGFLDKNDWATFKKGYKTYNGVMKAFARYRDNHTFQALTVREDIDYGYMSESSVIAAWEI